MRSRKILILTSVGGFVTQFELENIKILQELGYTVYHATDLENPSYPMHRERLEQMGVQLYHVPIAKSPYLFSSNWKAYQELEDIIKREQIEVIHCHNPVGGVLGRLLGFRFAKKGIKVIYTAHGFHFYAGAPLKNRVFFYPVEKFLARATDVLITINREDYENGKKMHLRPGGQVYQIPGVGIREERLYELPNANVEIRKRYGIPMEAFHMVSVGELNQNKNHAVVIRAIARMKELDIYYTICGEGTEREHLQELIKSLGLEKRVFLAGYQEEIAPYLQSGDVFVFPSIREGLGMAALEAMAMGLPVIATKNRGTLEYIKDGENGFFCPWNNSMEFAKAIMTLYGNPRKRREMGSCAKETAATFKVEETVKKMREIYQKLLCEDSK